jgi:hypothetical protein
MQALANKSFLGAHVAPKASKASCGRKSVTVRATAAPVTKLNTKRSEEVIARHHIHDLQRHNHVLGSRSSEG